MILPNNMQSMQYYEKIQRLRLIDDDFMRIALDGNSACAELMIRELTGIEDIHIIQVQTQKEIHSLMHRSAIFDVLAKDSSGKQYEIELQKNDRGAAVKRARYYSSILDMSMVKKGKQNNPEEALKESYVIFITEHDIMEKGKAIYQFDRMEITSHERMEDGTHILYANGSYQDVNTRIGRLMHDIFCPDAEKMYYKELAECVRYYKSSEEGVNKMCQIWEEIKEEGRKDGIILGKKQGILLGKKQQAIETAQYMLKKGLLEIEEIAEYSKLSIDEIKQLKAEMQSFS